VNVDAFIHEKTTREVRLEEFRRHQFPLHLGLLFNSLKM